MIPLYISSKKGRLFGVKVEEWSLGLGVWGLS